MKLATSLTAILLLTTATAGAGSSYIAEGLYCTAREDIAAAFELVDRGTTLALAIAAVNQDQVRCVWADKVGYMVTSPSIVGGFHHRGGWQIIYQARLVGVLVGGNPRPVEPPVDIFFAPTETLPDSVVGGPA